jgi:hypothetical protein
MSNDNMNGNGNTDPVLAAALGGQVPMNPVNTAVVQALSDALDRARRGEIHAVALVGVRGTDLSSFDTIAVENMALAMIMLGAIQVVSSKITQGAREAQQVQTRGPSSKILRPGAVG